MIIVEDDFFKADLASLVAKGTESYHWRYQNCSTNSATDNRFFVSYLWTPSCEHNLFYALWKLIRNKIPSVEDCDCWRIIANGQMKGQNGNWHTDHGDKTILYYPTTWNPEWGGSTYFKIDGLKKEIQYKQNRLVIFDSVPHYGSGPIVDNILRVSIAFNLRLKGIHLPKTI
jgi:hypothetical protein